MKWLQENNFSFEVLDIIKDPPSKERLLQAFKQFGGCKKLFNKSGKSYRNIGSKVIKSMTPEQSLEALSNDPKLIKRPFLLTDKGEFIVGFNELVWSETLKK